MIFVVDANIIFSAVLNPARQIGTILTGLIRNDIILISPEFLKNELQKHKGRLCELVNTTPEIIDELLLVYYKKITFYPEKIIPAEIWNHADALTKGVDIKDSVYIAFTMFFQCKLWSGDRPEKSSLNKRI